MRAVWKKIRYRLEWLALKSRRENRPTALAQGLLSPGANHWGGGRHVRPGGPPRRVKQSPDCIRRRTFPRRRDEIVRESYQHFARTMIDLFWSPRLTRENYSRHIDVVNLDLWREELKPGNPVIFACCHYSNFEWVAGRGQLFRRGERARDPGIQESVAQSDFCQPAGKQRSAGHTSRRRRAPTLQDAPPRRARGDPDRPDDSRAIADGGDRLFRLEDERDLRARLGASARGRDDHQRSLRAAARWALPHRFSSPDRICRRTRPFRKSRRHAGTNSSRSSARTPRRGFGCTSIGAIGPLARTRRSILSTRTSRRSSNDASTERAKNLEPMSSTLTVHLTPDGRLQPSAY